MSRPDSIPRVQVDAQTASFLDEILAMGDEPSDDLLKRLIPNRDEYLSFLRDHGLDRYEPARKVLARLDAANSRVRSKAIRQPKKYPTRGITQAVLIREIAAKLELTNRQVATFFDILADTAIKQTKKNGAFLIPGIGRLVKAERNARMGRNPQTGEAIKIKSKIVVRFRVAKSASRAVSEGRSRTKGA